MHCRNDIWALQAPEFLQVHRVAYVVEAGILYRTRLFVSVQRGQETDPAEREAYGWGVAASRDMRSVVGRSIVASSIGLCSLRLFRLRLTLRLLEATLGCCYLTGSVTVNRSYFVLISHR